LEAFFSVFSFGAAFSLAIVLSDFGWWTVVDGLCCGGSKQKNAIQKIGLMMVLANQKLAFSDHCHFNQS
jgi:hypothetical protein